MCFVTACVGERDDPRGPISSSRCVRHGCLRFHEHAGAATGVSEGVMRLGCPVPKFAWAPPNLCDKLLHARGTAFALLRCGPLNSCPELPLGRCTSRFASGPCSFMQQRWLPRAGLATLPVMVALCGIYQHRHGCFPSSMSCEAFCCCEQAGVRDSYMRRRTMSMTVVVRVRIECVTRQSTTHNTSEELTTIQQVTSQACVEATLAGRAPNAIAGAAIAAVGAQDGNTVPTGR